MTSPLADRAARYPVLESRTLGSGHKFGLDQDVVDLGPGGRVSREYLTHPGSVAVLVLDEDERVLLIRQYRHPVRGELWELPAGLRDEPGEPAVRTAARELAEETDLSAARWWRLVDFYASPGCSDEQVEVFLARDLRRVPDGERHERRAEELGIEPIWVPLAEAVTAVRERRVRNPAAVAGILAVAMASADGWQGLDPVEP
ncbi:NUDIX hydrolase [Isoptericola sp. b441]|uniref:NUDIX hydrolase n=1 Tax=Actinotalea lenta TaxID=3064654 RepID=A0ABT9DDS9_9CELL|nr:MULTISPECIES: NUDIX hydrolase [unclassified Isoptericola]MDO8107488.1 NUDIX hydrolase [Isoptericola sp. b441]MDO8120852.1 NUDIX hydrolase [Isoptericola sp. b490]